MDSPRGWRTGDGSGGPVGIAAELSYAAGVRVRRWLYDRSLLAASPPPTPTISVGGLEVGGSGKTPVTGVVLRALLQAGRRPGLLTRGYRRRSRGLVTREPGAPADPDRLGDEPAMLVQGGLDIPVAACGDRRAGAAALVALGCDSLVLDDGFSHRALGRHADIVVLRGEAPFGNGHLLPRGTLREPPSSLLRASLLWFHYRTTRPAASAGAIHEVAPAVRRALDRYCPDVPHVVSRTVPGPAEDDAGQPVTLEGARVLAAAGIARPEDFRHTLQEAGATVLELVARPDHHRWSVAELQALEARAATLGAAAIAVTAKDAVKLRAHHHESPLWTVAMRVEVMSGAEALQGCVAAVAR